MQINIITKIIENIIKNIINKLIFIVLLLTSIAMIPLLMLFDILLIWSLLIFDGEFIDEFCKFEDWYGDKLEDKLKEINKKIIKIKKRKVNKNSNK